MHILTADQAPNGSTQVLYKRRTDSSGYLGGGSFGAVHLETIDSECRDAPAIRAVKSISKRAAKASKVHWEQEVENLILLSQIFGWWEDDASIFLPMEYFEASDLSTQTNKDSIRDEDDIRTISQQLALGLQQMHSLNIIHRDIKPQNVFVAQRRPTWHVKIGDFGFSKRVSDSVSSPFSARGTTKYMAPEYRDLMNNCESSDFTTAVDMWSFGCLVYELFARKCPFDEDDTHALMDYVRGGEFPRQPLDDCGASDDSIWLIKKLLERVPDLRSTAEEALHCAWLTIAAAPASHESPRENSVVHEENSIASLSTSTVTLSSTDTVDAMPASLRGTLPHTVFAPPELVVVPDETQIGKDSAQVPPDALSRPPLPERAITVPETSIVRISTDDASLPTSRTIQVPGLPPRPKSSNAMRPDALQGIIKDMKLAEASDQAFHNLPLTAQSTESISSTRSITRKPVAKVASSSSTSAMSVPTQTTSTQLFPYMKTSQLSSDYIDIAFKNIKFKPQRKPTCDICESRRVFNPIIKPAELYFCKDCGHRPLCARCIVGSIKTQDDPHEADHKLQLWVQAHIFPLQEFLDRFQPLDVESDGLDSSLGKSWLSSDHSFTPPAEGACGTRWILNAPAGEFNMSIQVRVTHRKEAIESSTIGIQKSTMVKSRAVPLGSILFGARVVGPAPTGVPSDDERASRHLPDRPVEQEIKLAKEEQTLTLKLGFNLNATAKQKIEVHIRGSYDMLYFKAGSPFKWWLDRITITQLGAEQHVASMGDQIMRENAKQLQAKQKRKQRVAQGVGLVGQGLGFAGAKGPVKQGQVVISALSAGLGLGGSMMRQSNQQRPMASNQPAPVYNNYYFSMDQSQQQDDQGYAYQEADDDQQQYYEEYDEEEFGAWQQQQQQQQQQIQ
ncbi:MAG: hypothetical protein Q9213_007791 [Squamulea squamosa]